MFVEEIFDRLSLAFPVQTWTPELQKQEGRNGPGRFQRLPGSGHALMDFMAPSQLICCAQVGGAICQ